MHTVAELYAFRKAAEKAGMSDRDVARLVTFLSRNPDAGDVIEGTGGCRKLRFALESSAKGKSGGVRTITLFSGAEMPVFLLTVFAKGQKVSLSKAERNELKKATGQIVQEYRNRVQRLAAGDEK